MLGLSHFIQTFQHRYISKEGSYPFEWEMSVALLEKPSPEWIQLEFRADSLTINGVKSGSGTSSALLPVAVNFISVTGSSSV